MASLRLWVRASRRLEDQCTIHPIREIGQMWHKKKAYLVLYWANFPDDWILKMLCIIIYLGLLPSAPPVAVLTVRVLRVRRAGGPLLLITTGFTIFAFPCCHLRNATNIYYKDGLIYNNTRAKWFISLSDKTKKTHLLWQPFEITQSEFWSTCLTNRV